MHHVFSLGHKRHQTRDPRLLNRPRRLALMKSAQAAPPALRDFEIRRNKPAQGLDILVINRLLAVDAIVTLFGFAFFHIS